jgi:hypothetical protein
MDENSSSAALTITLRHFPQDATYAILFREMICIHYCRLIRIAMGQFEKIARLFLAAYARGPYF